MQKRNREEAHLQRATPFLRKQSPYAFDFHTAVLILFHQGDLTVDEIKADLDGRVRELHLEGPRVQTIIEWLCRFHRDAKEHTSFFTQTLSDHHFNIPPVLPPDKQATHRDYTSRYFLECISALHTQLHPKDKHPFRFLMYANTLLLRSGKAGLFAAHPP